MKHLSSLHQTFPHLPNRGAIMGLVQRKKTPVELAEEEVELKQKSSQFVAVKVYFTVRRHLPPCHCAVVSVPLAARVSDLMETAWGMFLEYREKMGEFLGPPPSESMDDYTLCFLEHPHTQGSYRRMVHEVQTAVANAAHERRKSSVVPGAFLMDGANHAVAGEPLSMDELMARVTPQENSLSVSPAQSALDLGNANRRRSARSASIVSSATVVTLEALDEEEIHRDSDDDDDDVGSGQQTGHGTAGDSGKTNNIIDVALRDFRAYNRVSQAVRQIVPPQRQVCEDCPPSAIVSRLVANRLKKKAEAASAPVVVRQDKGDGNAMETAAGQSSSHHAHELDDGLVSVHLLLKPLFEDRENVVLVEEKTRKVIERVWQLSEESMKTFERMCFEQTKIFEVRRAVELEQIHAFQEKEHSIRHKHQRLEHSTWVEAIHEFKKRYNELEVGMIAQYRQIRELRRAHSEKLREMGLTSPDDDVLVQIA